MEKYEEETVKFNVTKRNVVIQVSLVHHCDFIKELLCLNCFSVHYKVTKQQQHGIKKFF